MGGYDARLLPERYFLRDLSHQCRIPGAVFPDSENLNLPARTGGEKNFWPGATRTEGNISALHGA
jgi:hypothetical protein